MQEEFLYRLLQEKEERVRRQREVLEAFPKTLVSFGLNLPGSIKNSKEIQGFFQRALQKIEQAIVEEGYAILYREQKAQETGNLALLVINTEEASRIKELLIALESNLAYGRILDLDVIDKTGRGISRSDLGLGARKCLLCERDAVFCMRNQSHSYEDLHQKAMEYIKMGG